MDPGGHLLEGGASERSSWHVGEVALLRRRRLRRTLLGGGVLVLGLQISLPLKGVSM